MHATAHGRSARFYRAETNPTQPILSFFRHPFWEPTPTATYV